MEVETLGLHGHLIGMQITISENSTTYNIIIIIFVLQPFVGPLAASSVFYLVHSRYHSLDGRSARCETDTCSQHSTTQTRN
jgi:hypothetical protein